MKNKNEKTPHTKNWGGTFGWIILILLCLVFVGYLLLKGLLFVKNIKDSWKELQFTFTHTRIIKVIREDYEKKQAELDESFSNREKTAEERLIDQVVEELTAPKK